MMERTEPLRVDMGVAFIVFPEYLPKQVHRVHWSQAFNPLRAVFLAHSERPFFFGGIGIWIQDFAFAKQAPYHLSHTSVHLL
jgi:hypothetical protein